MWKIYCVWEKKFTENFKQILDLILEKLFLVVGPAKYWGNLKIPINRDLKNRMRKHLFVTER